MNFRQLEYILAVHEQGHFGRAAEHCGVTQATLSAMVKRLEEELDITIFDRSRSPVVPTEEGLVVVSMSRDLLIKSDGLKNLKSSLRGRLSGALRIGVIPTVAPLLLPIVLKPFVSLHPDVDLSIKEATTDQLLIDLKEGVIDGAIVASPVLDEDLFGYHLYSEALKVYGVNDLAKREMTPGDIKSTTVWLLEEGHCLKDQVVAFCGLQEQKTQFDGLNVQCSSFATLVGLVDDFGGYTLLPELYVNIMSQRRQNRTRSFVAPEPVRDIAMVVYRPFVKKMLLDELIRLVRMEMEDLRGEESIDAEIAKG